MVCVMKAVSENADSTISSIWNKLGGMCKQSAEVGWHHNKMFQRERSSLRPTRRRVYALECKQKRWVDQHVLCCPEEVWMRAAGLTL